MSGKQNEDQWQQYWKIFRKDPSTDGEIELTLRLGNTDINNKKTHKTSGEGRTTYLYTESKRHTKSTVVS